MAEVTGADDARPAGRRPRVVVAAGIAAVVVVGLVIAAFAYSASSGNSSGNAAGKTAASSTTRPPTSATDGPAGPNATPTTKVGTAGPGGASAGSATSTPAGNTSGGPAIPTTAATATPGGPRLVPALVGTPLGAARASVEKAGFVVSLVFKSSILQKGLVLDSTPGAGARAARGSTVTLFISRGDLVDVPTWIGLESSTANMDQIKTEARASGLRVGFDGTSSCTSKGATVTGRFVAQSPAGGGQFPRGTTVVLTAKCPA